MLVAGLLLTVLIFSWTGALRSTSGKEPKEQKTVNALVHVSDKTIETKDGKTTYIIEFQMNPYKAIWVTNKAKYDSVSKGQEVLLTFEQNPATGGILRVTGFTIPKFWKPEQD